ncbi:MAG: glycerophosphoryl diester phosphodiesterase membrane domain-containing protein [Gemmatimonadaceae bacterium]|nr:glycerophosphoryl diester phosphodiesterase membrane domain-containing protein [Gemmatimonadaceae bacterium]
MSEQTLRPRTTSELLDATFSLYRRHAPAYIMVTAIAVVPTLLFQLLLLGGSASLGQTLAAFIIFPISMVSYALMNGVVIRMGSDVYLGGEADVAEAVRSVMPKVPSLIGTAILKTLALMLYFLLLFFPMFIAFAKYFGPEAAVVLEGRGAAAAMSRSAELADGRKWHILGALLLMYGIYIIVGFALGIVGAVAGALGSEMGGQVVLLFVQTLITIVSYPIVGLMTMLLYYDCRIRKEGFDVEHLARTLGDAVPAPAR